MPSNSPYELALSEISEIGQIDNYWRVGFRTNIDWLSTQGLDQRIKLLVPTGEKPVTKSLIGQDDWYQLWRQSPDLQQDLLRTLTIFNPKKDGTFEILVHQHKPMGILGNWLQKATKGSEVVIALPNKYSDDISVGVDWKPTDASEITAIVDNSSLPAILSISSSKYDNFKVYALVDSFPIDIAKILEQNNVQVNWLVGTNEETSKKLLSLFEANYELDKSDQIIWEKSEDSDVKSYIWVAGETSLVKSLRKQKNQIKNFRESSTTFLGYWKKGKTE